MGNNYPLLTDILSREIFFRVKANPNRIRVTRADKRVTQLDLSLAVGMSQSKLSLIENGYVVPSEAERDAIAKALGVSQADLFPEVAA